MLGVVNKSLSNLQKKGFLGTISALLRAIDCDLMPAVPNLGTSEDQDAVTASTDLVQDPALSLYLHSQPSFWQNLQLENGLIVQWGLLL